MFQPGADPDNLVMADILCDFCHHEWTETRPMVEGHRNGCICGSCLLLAYNELAVDRRTPAPAQGYTCTLCKSERNQRAWVSPAFPDAIACERCVRQATQALDKDKDIDWSRPPAPGPSPDSHPAS